MNFPKFWARGTHGSVHSWRWSDRSEADARTQADAAAGALAARLANGQLRNARHDYYADRPLREPVLREFPGSDGSPAAVVTRNSYGCLVLNTARALFVDVDLPDAPSPSGGGLIARLFGRQTRPDPSAEADAILDPLRRFQQSNAGWSWRVYRTRAGFRLLATHALFEPGASEVEMVFEALRADPLYRKLCLAQKCFRARLTPKPWRCGRPASEERWPWLDAGAEQRFEAWRQRYEQAGARYATCKFLRTEGSTSIHADLAALVAFHDETSRAMTDAPLA